MLLEFLAALQQERFGVRILSLARQTCTQEAHHIEPILRISPTSRIRPLKKYFGSPNPSKCWGIVHPESAKRL
jgi:hypothetical protein